MIKPKLWIDAEYFVVLKDEMTFSDGFFDSFEVKKIEYNIKLNNKLFEKAEGIIFN